MKTERINLSQIQLNTANPRTISSEKMEKLVDSLLVLPKMLELRPIVIDEKNTALGGNMRFRALSAIAEMDSEERRARLERNRDYGKKTEAEQQALLEYWERWAKRPTAYVIKASELSEAEQREFIIKDNVGFGDWDYDMLANEWDEKDLDAWGLDVWQNSEWERGNESGDTNSAPANASLNDRFVVPPFSVLDTRKGYWQQRKAQWRAFIGEFGESRNDELISSPEIKYKDLYQRTRQHREKLGISFKEYLEKYVPEEVKQHEESKVLSAGVSLFDPVLSEVCCRWFTPQRGAKIFDCFAGDTLKGLVFGKCGYEFTGIELRPEQVEINNRRVKEHDLPVRYICDDGQNVAQHLEPQSQDLLFSCPPYFDLEHYSDLENDASNQGSYEDFIRIIENAFKAAVGCLRENRFAVVVVGDVRDKQTGFYYDFCGDVKRIFREAGCPLYNEIILVETGASTALRASRYMESRKVAKMHQNILVFYKGEAKSIKKNFDKLDYSSEDLELFAKQTQSEIEETSPTSDE